MGRRRTTTRRRIKNTRRARKDRKLKKDDRGADKCFRRKIQCLIKRSKWKRAGKES